MIARTLSSVVFKVCRQTISTRLYSPSSLATFTKPSPLLFVRNLCVQIPFPPLKVGATSSRDEQREFMAVFPDVVRDLTKSDFDGDLEEVLRWYSKVLHYNVPTGKLTRGLSMVDSYKTLMDPVELTPDNLNLARIMGWCVELFHSFFLIHDDLMDKSSTRRGKPCWYKTNDLGVLAVNDGILLEAGLFTLLRKYFREYPYYIDVMELFNESILRTAMGQSMDVKICPSGNQPNLSMFTMQRYKAVAEYKTAFYSFYLPVALAMHMAGVTKPELFRQANTILMDTGFFFQVQDDYLDCFGDQERTGKEGTDIRDGKCTWMAVVALQRASEIQRNLMEENYGVDDPECVSLVRQLYEDLELEKVYRRFEEDNYLYLKLMAHQTSKCLPQEVFLKFIERIYQRDH